MLNISLPNQITDFIEQQAISDGFNTPSEYATGVRDLTEAQISSLKTLGASDTK